MLTSVKKGETGDGSLSPCLLWGKDIIEITEVSSNGDRVGFCYDIIMNHRDGS